MRHVIVLALLCVLAASRVRGDDISDSGSDFSAVTCGSAVKLRHQSTNFLLHSHNIKWGSGSGQQSVTAVETNDDPNSLWQIKEAYGAAPCVSGTPLKCGDTIRLAHVQTRLHLHSHMHSAPISGRQEISCYGADAVSDSGDNWRIDCTNANAPTPWLRSTAVAFTHVDTSTRLFTGRDAQFNNNNCRGCPIIGQLEMSAHKTSGADTLWKVDDGIFFPDLTANKQHSKADL